MRNLIKFCIGVFLFLLSAFYPCFLCAQQYKIVAVVNHDAITQKDLNDFVNFLRLQLSEQLSGRQLEEKIQEMKKDLLDRLIEDKLILQEAKHMGIKPDESRVKDKIAQIKKKYPSDKDFQEALIKQGLAQEDLENKIRDQYLSYMAVETNIKNKIRINPADVTDFYQKNKDQFIIPETRQIQSLAVSDSGKVQEILSQAKEGASFKDLSSKYAITADRMSVGGKGKLSEEIEKVIFDLKENEISKPVWLAGTYYIFKLDKIIPSQKEDFEAVKGAIYDYLFNLKMEEGMSSWLADMKKNSYISIVND
ncbi:MAG: peptidyl-prolyl cis-trans isomerase [Candidatus Omnitrophica bacterium]|jgi:parvulin-like peptidyl-prolyl isomerase|nr:peptidyl-prolyl cis-trans isomerase [Candidatus Omnitrophota bacterium]